MQGFHNNVTAVAPAIDRAERRFSQRHRRCLCISGRRRETAGDEGRHVVVARRLDVTSELRVHLDDGHTLLVFCRNGFLAAILGVDSQRTEFIDAGLERDQIDRWSGISRIVQDTVVRCQSAP